MQIVEINLSLPYESRGKILKSILERVRGKVRDVHFFPPNAKGLSEVRLELLVSDAQRLIKELKGTIKNGKISVKVLSA
ncbi:hypothetical protein A3K92_02370 [Thermococcus gorgonarius]|uniref:Uncharacterized protein n=2 Tax=Thermococcus gorgonarius TaxID=71997 RepID=A0A2Z2M5Q3_THEGO|nr:hypothetical protein [Thermococcus gorgonarius]ASJ00409.1 hypothetical protein A3K92_02370 [Thermococcus gorgonarius]